MIQTLERYTIGGALGGGSGGRVFKAIQDMGEGIRRTVAIKLLTPLPPGDAARHQQFLDEAKVLVALSGHPNIVNILDFGVDEHQPWIAMEFVEHTLADRITDAPADPAAVGDMIAQACQGLLHMHEQSPPVLHNDMKPSNLLVDSIQHYKIADFGLAAEQSADRTYGVGTIQYVAPEVLRDDLGRRQPASDLYSLGLMAYEMALGRATFRRQFPTVFGADASPPVQKWLAWHCDTSTVPPRIDAIVPTFPRTLADIIEKLVAKPLTARYAHARQVLEDLAGKVGRTSRFASPPRPVAAPKRKNHAVMGFAVAGMLVVLLAVLLLDGAPSPFILLREPDNLSTPTAMLSYEGKVDPLPAGVMLQLKVADHSYTIDIGADGKFSGSCRLPAPGEFPGQFLLTSGLETLAQRDVILRRTTPATVLLRIRTLPSIARATLTISTEGAAGMNATTGPDGTVAISVPCGKLTIELSHAAYDTYRSTVDTGFESEKELQLQLAERKAVLRFVVTPATASVSVARDGDAKRTPVVLDEHGRGSIAMAPGRYSCIIDSPQHVPQRKSFVLAGEEFELRAELMPVVAQSPPTPQPPPDELRLAKMTMEELKADVLARVPAGVAVVAHESPTKYRLTGVLLNQRELDTMSRRLTWAASRLDWSEVRVDGDAVAKRVQAALRKSGFPDAHVRTYPKQNDGELFMRATITSLDETTNAAATAQSQAFVIDADLLILVINKR